ncbi:hypothetical protein J6590_000719 [Homalodisca vitripennis]|nr:hypothetical protein J6590_000719 [Homalodisca vitripennis]
MVRVFYVAKTVIRGRFRRLELLPLPSLYMYETVLCCRYKFKTTRGRDVHGCNTMGRDVLRTKQHRLRAYEALSCEVGDKLVVCSPSVYVGTKRKTSKQHKPEFHGTGFFVFKYV